LAQVGAAQEITLRKQFVTMAPAELTTIARGHSVPVELQFRITPGYHINSNRPKQEYLRKTVLNLDAPTDIAIERVVYPERLQWRLCAQSAGQAAANRGAGEVRRAWPAQLSGM
jgi:hypothetical protein